MEPESAVALVPFQPASSNDCQNALQTSWNEQLQQDTALASASPFAEAPARTRSFKASKAETAASASPSQTCFSIATSRISPEAATTRLAIGYLPVASPMIAA